MRESLRPLKPEEREAVFRAADAHLITGRPQDWCGQLVRFFCWTGIHPITLCDPDRFELRFEHGTLNWTRAKNERQMELPVKEEMKPWIQSFLDTPRPSSERSYHRILTDVGKEAQVKLNFLRLRHTAMVVFHRDMEMNAADCMRLLGVTPRVFRVYAERPMEDIEADLRRKGW